MSEADRYYQLTQACFNCTTAAYKRGDWEAFKRAMKLHKKYRHLYEQVKARAKLHR